MALFIANLSEVKLIFKSVQTHKGDNKNNCLEKVLSPLVFSDLRQTFAVNDLPKISKFKGGITFSCFLM